MIRVISVKHDVTVIANCSMAVLLSARSGRDVVVFHVIGDLVDLVFYPIVELESM